MLLRRLGYISLTKHCLPRFFLQEEASSSDDEDRPRKVGFSVEEETERHDRLKRTNTPHYTKGKRLYTNKEDVQEKFHEIMARVGGPRDIGDEDGSEEQRVRV